MEQLLQAIKAALEGMGEFASVFLTPLITEDFTAFPPQMTLPAAAITMGPDDAAQDGTAEGLTLSPLVKVATYVGCQATDMTVGFTDALALADKVRQTLHRNLLGLTGVILAHYEGGEGSTVVEFPGAGTASQIIQNFRYELEE